MFVFFESPSSMSAGMIKIWQQSSSKSSFKKLYSVCNRWRLSHIGLQQKAIFLNFLCQFRNFLKPLSVFIHRQMVNMKPNISNIPKPIPMPIRTGANLTTQALISVVQSSVITFWLVQLKLLMYSSWWSASNCPVPTVFLQQVRGFFRSGQFIEVTLHGMIVPWW